MKCPGQDSRYWKPGAIFEAKCPKCGEAVEFFKDDTTRRCRACGHRFLNPSMDFGCAAYCTYAEQCIGNLPPELIAQKKDLLKDRVGIEVKRRLGRDFKAVGRTLRRARYAEKIGKEEGADLGVVLPAAYLFELRGEDGCVRDLLEGLGAGESLIKEVTGAIDHSEDLPEDAPLESRCLWDALWIARLEDSQQADPLPLHTLEAMIRDTPRTPGGRRVAEALFLNQ